MWKKKWLQIDMGFWIDAIIFINRKQHVCIKSET